MAADVSVIDPWRSVSADDPASDGVPRVADVPSRLAKAGTVAMAPKKASERVLTGGIGAYVLHSKYDSHELTKAARAAFESDLKDVKNLLGHSTIVLTSNTYGHVLEERQQEMACGMDAVLCRSLMGRAGRGIGSGA